MAKKRFRSRKRRTREHIIADQSVNHIEKILIDAGQTATRVDKDYGYDLMVITYSARGYVQSGNVYLQLKASDQLKLDKTGKHYAFQLDRRDHELWRDEPMPVFFVLYDAVKRRAYWLYMQQYFERNPNLRKKLKTASISIHVPGRNRFTAKTVELLREKKLEVLRQLKGVIKHV